MGLQSLKVTVNCDMGEVSVQICLWRGDAHAVLSRSSKGYSLYSIVRVDGQLFASFCPLKERIRVTMNSL